MASEHKRGASTFPASPIRRQSTSSAALLGGGVQLRPRKRAARQAAEARAARG